MKQSATANDSIPHNLSMGTWTRNFLVPKPDPSLLDIIQSPPETSQQDGPWLINRRHGCRIRAQGQAAGNQGFFRLPDQVFAFRVADTEIDCLAIRPDQLRKFFDLKPTQKCLKDESFFAGSFPARFLTVKDENPQQHWTSCRWFLEREGLIYEFSPRGQMIPPESALASITETIRSFEVLTDTGK